MDHNDDFSSPSHPLNPLNPLSPLNPNNTRPGVMVDANATPATAGDLWMLGGIVTLCCAAVAFACWYGMRVAENWRP